MHFVRHGQSEFNLAQQEYGRDPGILDAPLTPLGFEQARRAAKDLAGRGITSIIASPYTRALQTASTIAAEIGAGLHICPLAGERRIYSCDIGSPLSRLKETWTHLDFSGVPTENWWPAADESLGDLSRRVVAFKSKWKDLATPQNALVSHWYFINALTGRDMENGEVAFHAVF
jgi:broad specificity phosphatase PhoE